MSTNSKDPIESNAEVDPSERLDTDYSPSSERETEVLQDDQGDSPVFADPGIDRSAVNLLPGTGDYDDPGDVDVEPGEIRMPHLPAGRADAGPPEE